MADSRCITLVYKGSVIASWSSKFQSISMREAKLHVPSCFEPGSYKIIISGKELVDYVSMLNTNVSDVALTIVPTSLRVSVTLRMLSGDLVMDWPVCAPYHRLGDLAIPGIRKTYTIVKQGQALEDHDRVWLEGDPDSVELTMVIIRESYFVFHLYVHLGGPGEYTAFLLPGFSVTVPASSQKNNCESRCVCSTCSCWRPEAPSRSIWWRCSPRT